MLLDPIQCLHWFHTTSHVMDGRHLFAPCTRGSGLSSFGSDEACLVTVTIRLVFFMLFFNFCSVHRAFLPSFDPHTQSQVAPVLGPPLQECMPRFRKFHVVPNVHHRIITSCYRARKQSCNLPTVSTLLWFQKETDTFSRLS